MRLSKYQNGRSLTQTPTPAPIEILQYDLNQSRFRVTTDQPAYFLLSDIYHPDWRASVDGQEAEIFAADYALRAVYLEPGSHEIRFWFRPASWQMGLALTAVSWLALLVYGWLTFRRSIFFRQDLQGSQDFGRL